MYLKSVEIHGFKSFANKMVLSFGNGITGIVGPNGSGKSNVADAVRWVLGEQSAKQLRGSRMEDVIFAGTKIKKAQSFAYVAITLDNSDHLLPIEYEEVVVARRVYRSGESEYLINGHQCRLKDVQELFLDTGIGKEGYSIIGQGQIEKILSGRPEDRRELFDEAAGITKFKKRKVSAIKNLEEETANLLRVEDILSELSRQVTPLYEQSEKAKKYLSYRDELKKYEIVHFISEYDRATDIQKKAERDKEVAEKSLCGVSEELTSSRQEYETIELTLEEKNSGIEELSTQISENLLSREKLEGNIQVIHEKIRSAKRDFETFHERMTKEESRIRLLTDEKTSVEKKEEVLSQRERELQEEVLQLQDKIRCQQDERKLLETEKAKRQEEGLRFEKEKAEASGLIKLYSSNVEQNKIKRLEINGKILRNKESIRSIQTKLDEAEAKGKKVEEDIGIVQSAFEDLRSLNDSLKMKRVEKEKEYRAKQKELLSAKAVLSSMKNMALRYDGYGNSVKQIMERKKVEPGIIGVVADIIKVHESYELAIETAMGASIQNIVTDKEETAKRTIQFLKSQKLGRATFLPLDAMGLHNPGNFGGALNENGILGVAASLVEFEPKYAGIISHILGRTLVADTMDTATRIARKYKYSLRIVTLEGEQLNPGGSISGGAYRNANHLLGRTREIEEKEKEIEKTDRELTFLTKEGEELGSSIEENKKSMEQYKSRLSELYVEKNTIIHSISQLKERMDEVEKLSAEIWLDADRLDREKENALQEIERLNSILFFEGKIGESSIQAIEKEIQKTEETIFLLQNDLQERNISLTELHSEQGFHSVNLERLEKELTEVRAEIAKLEENNCNYSLRLAENEGEISALKEEISCLSTTISEKEEARALLTEERENLSKTGKKIFLEREELSDIKAQLEKELLRLSNAIEKAEHSMQTLVDYMAEEYSLTYSEIMKSYEPEEEISPFALKKMILEKKSQMKDLGSVNVQAIEEYKETSERYEHLKRQHEDIVKAETTLRAVIEELDKKMREQFELRFKDINRSFDLAFAELFGGGSGKLMLTEGEDILEAGIKIIAEPPGKKLQNMMQLSGGEKALTAIALLFAIQNLKPSPFCLLDEIEAALDDSNVVRFAEYLHKLTKNTQFIVITHRRGTMNAADVLYGITMQEKGISTMVSVNLIEAQLSN